MKKTKPVALALLVVMAFCFKAPSPSYAEMADASLDVPSTTAADAGNSEATELSAAYAHTVTAEQNGITFTVGWNDAPAGSETTFHVTQTGGSSSAKARMDVPTYWDTDGSQESVCDPSRDQWGSYYELGENGYDFSFGLTASGTYRINFYFMDTDSGIWYLRTTVIVEISDAARPSVTQIVNNAVAQCRAETSGSEYDMALWLHDWALDQLEYDHSLNYCSAESGLTRGLGTCESYQRIYAKLLNAAGIANGRVEGNGHTWNAARIDGKWCQMDLTWDDTNDNWYGDLDQRHLYFGLTDELMAIAHSDHAKNYQADDYAYRSVDLSNNYFVRNGKASEWVENYAERIQRHLDAHEESFSIDADNGSFPPSISGIQNAIVAYAMNQQEWSVNGVSVSLEAASNVTTVSSREWTAKYEFEAKYQTSADYVVVYHKSVTSEAATESTPVAYGHSTPTLASSDLGFSDDKTRFLGWRCFRDSDNAWWITLPNGNADWVEAINGKLPDGCTYRLLSDGWKTGWSTRSGVVHLYGCWQSQYSVQYHASLGIPAAQQSTDVEVGSPTLTLTPSELGFTNGDSAFLGWRCYRDENGTWWANLPNGTCGWVKESSGQLPTGCTYALLPSGFRSTRTAESGSAHFFAVWKGSYTLGYRQSAAEPPSAVTTDVTHGISTETESVSDLGFEMNGNDFAGWRCFRDIDQKWWATLPNGNADWVALENGRLPEGYRFRLLPNRWQTGWSAGSGAVELVATWKNSYTVSYHLNESAPAHPISANVTYGMQTAIPTIAELGYIQSDHDFEGWKCYRDSDGKWWATKADGQADWVQTVNGDLPSGCTYRLLPDGWRTAWSTWAGSVQLYAAWK